MRPRVPVVALLAIGLVVAAVAGVCLGSIPLSVGEVAGELRRRIAGAPGTGGPVESIVWAVRLPRVLLAAVVGGGLAVVGTTLQSVFRNPLADAGLLGVGAGAALGGVLSVHWGWAAETFFALPACAFAGALIASLVIYAAAHVSGRPSLYELLLTGLSVSALASAGLSILLVATEEFRVKTVLFWLAGGLEGRSWPHLVASGTFVIVGSLGLLLLARSLDVLSLGDDEAASLGIGLHQTRMLLLALASLVAGAATAISGSVPFVGLVAPHALRRLVGPRAGTLLPAAFLGGAILVVLADLASRVVARGIDLPLGSLTAIVGAPYLLVALRASEGR